MAKEMNYEALQANLKMIDKKGEQAFEQARAAGTLTPEQEKFSALISDEAFLEKFFAADSAEEVQLLFKENGLEISVEEINVYGKYIADVSKKLIENGGELSEADLEEVAGGILGVDGDTPGAEGTGGAIGLLVGFNVGAIGLGMTACKVGAAIGGILIPGWGIAIGGFIGAAIGGSAGAIGGIAGGWQLGKKAVKLGKWIKSWF